MNKQQNMTTLLIVSGTGERGTLGNAYIEAYKHKPDVTCVNFSRTSYRIESSENRVSDLLNEQQTKECIDNLSITGIEQIIFIHCVGKFKFEKEDSPTIDSEVYTSNCRTFDNIARPLLQKIYGTDINVMLCGFGSISDKYNVPYWKSYSHAKKELKKKIKEYSTMPQVSGLSVNVSSVNTPKENTLRPYADKRYWLDSKDIVDNTDRYVWQAAEKYCEIDIYIPDPYFQETFFTDYRIVFNRWSQEMGLQRREIKIER